MDLSLVIPAYNEAQRLGPTLDQIEAHATGSGLCEGPFEVIVVCDGCTDGTEAVARAYEGRLPLRVLSYRDNRGKGYAVRQGMLASMGALAVFMDADGSTPVAELPRLEAPIREGRADIVVASRRAAGARLTQPQPWHRRLLGRALSLHTRVVLGVSVLDTQCGFKLFRGDLARELFAALRCDGFAFDLELLWLAHRCRARVLEMGVEWGDVGGSSVAPLKDGLRMLYTTWRVRTWHGPLPPKTHRPGRGTVP